MVIDVEGSDSNEREERTVFLRLYVENLEEEFAVCSGCVSYPDHQSLDPADRTVQGLAAGHPRNYPRAQLATVWVGAAQEHYLCGPRLLQGEGGC